MKCSWAILCVCVGMSTDGLYCDVFDQIGYIAFHDSKHRGSVTKS